MSRPRTVTALALGLLAGASTLSTACGTTRQPPAVSPPSTVSQAKGPRPALTQSLDGIFDAPEFTHTTWAVLVAPLEAGEPLYRHNESRLLVPASNLKIVTLAAAAERLGWNYRFETRLATEAAVLNGVLTGDLLVLGGGDPTIGRGDRAWSSVFDEWVDTLKAAGIQRIDGRIVGDDDAFEDQRFGLNWAWDDFPYDYSAPIGALQYNENVVDLRVTPGTVVGARATAEILDAASGLSASSEVVTAAAASTVDLDFERFPGASVVKVVGSVPVDAPARVFSVAVDNPTLYFVRALKRALVERGIAVTGDAVDIDDVAQTNGTNRIVDPNVFTVLATHLSAPLTEVGTRLMKVSQNLYAETLLKRLSAGPGPATAKAGRDEMRAILTSWGVTPGEYVIWDGSGLSRRDYIAPTALVKVLTVMARDARHADPFAATLPVGGLDGTLDTRMKGSSAEGRVRAKTGSMSQVRTVAGYVTTADGQTLVFAIMANGFDVSSSKVDDATDRALAVLASFER
ncbi:MAG: D-alanyl-D-alanine carboxypeptidase/D-alanyl-D-alanine-endopeptidase [Vicinamibacterales bacterium]